MSHKRRDFRRNTFKIFVLSGNRVSSGQHSRGNIFPKLRTGVFLDISHPQTVGDIKTNMEVLGLLRPFFFHNFLWPVSIWTSQIYFVTIKKGGNIIL